MNLIAVLQSGGPVGMLSTTEDPVVNWNSDDSSVTALRCPLRHQHWSSGVADRKRRTARFWRIPTQSQQRPRRNNLPNNTQRQTLVNHRIADERALSLCTVFFSCFVRLCKTKYATFFSAHSSMWQGVAKFSFSPVECKSA